MNKKNLYFIFRIVLFAFAGLIFVYAMWSLSYCAEIISEAKASGQLTTKGNEYDIMSFYMGSCVQYIVFSLLLASAGLLFQKKTSPARTEVKTNIVPEISEEDKELDEWFDETNPSAK